MARALLILSFGVLVSGCFLDRSVMGSPPREQDASAAPDGGRDAATPDAATNDAAANDAASPDAGDDAGMCVERAEICNGLDDDCDGSLDDDGADDGSIGAACDGEDLDRCMDGVFACSGGTRVCTGDGGDDPDEVEVCDGVDNDCDGAIDENATHPSHGMACDGPDLDTCAEGELRGCVNGAPVCSDATGDALETCDGMDEDCDGRVDEGATSCPTGCTRVQDGARSYLFCVNGLQWADARDACRTAGYELVSVDDSTEQVFLSSQVAWGQSWWIGLRDRGPMNEGMHTWLATGAAPSFNGWAPGQPNNAGYRGAEQDCVLIQRNDTGFGWNDGECWLALMFICEAGP